VAVLPTFSNNDQGRLNGKMTFSACLREHWKVQFTVQRTLPIVCVAWHGVSSRSDGAHVGFRSATLHVLSAIVSFVVVNVIPRDRTGRARRRRGQAAATADCNNDEVRRKDVGFTSASQSRAAGNEIVDISAGENTVRRARNREGGLDIRRGGKDRGGGQTGNVKATSVGRTVTWSNDDSRISCRVRVDMTAVAA